MTDIQQIGRTWNVAFRLFTEYKYIHASARHPRHRLGRKYYTSRRVLIVPFRAEFYPADKLGRLPSNITE